MKSCKALQLTEAGCNKYGMIYKGVSDRGLVVVTSAGKFVNARRYPKMVLIATTYKGPNVELSAHGKSPTWTRRIRNEFN